MKGWQEGGRMPVMILPLRVCSILQLGFIYNNRWWYFRELLVFSFEKGSSIHLLEGETKPFQTPSRFASPLGSKNL